MSVKLIDTYNHINKVYYEKKKKSQFDDKNWDYIVRQVRASYSPGWLFFSRC